LSNLQRITLGSFLTYFIMSAMLAPIGILSGPMAEHYGRPVTEITAGFSWLTAGILVGAVLALFVIERLPVRRLLMALYGAIALSLLTLPLDGPLLGVHLRLGIVGLCCGIGLPTAALVIARSYDDARRASMLVVTDGCYSVAGYASSAAAVLLVGLALPWSSTYALLGIVAAIVLLLAAPSRYPEHPEAALGRGTPRWPAAVWCCMAALGLYPLGQSAMPWWLPQHVAALPGVSAEAGGRLVGQFWSGMFVAQLFVAWWVLRVGVRRLVRLAGVTTALLSLPMWLVTDMALLWLLAALWGFANLGLLKLVLSLATEQVPQASPRLVSGLLLGATAGTAVSPSVTSVVVELGGSGLALRFASGCFAVMVLLLWFAARPVPGARGAELALAAGGPRAGS